MENIVDILKIELYNEKWFVGLWIPSQSAGFGEKAREPLQKVRSLTETDWIN